MKQQIIKFKNKWDFIIYGIKIRKINPYFLIINILILIYTLSQYEQFISEKNILFLLLLIFINIIWQIISTTQDFYSYTKQTDYYCTSLSKISSQFRLDHEISNKYKIITISDLNNTIIYSEQINNILTSNAPIHIKVSHQKTTKVDKYIKTYKDTLTPFLNYKWHEIKNHNGSFYNEKKLCMASEIEEICNQKEYIVLVNKGSYYNSFLTNNIYNMRMSHQNGLYIEPPFNSKNYPIQALHTSYMSNHIGISTIAVSKNGYAIILRHNNKTAIFSNLLQPSGSGSMNFHDLQENQDFRVNISKAAERELCEETGIQPDYIQKTLILGFYRDLNRGGKPEFCCVSYLNINRYELQEAILPNESEQQDDFKTIKLFNNAEFIPSVLENIFTTSSKEFSLSLYMNYFMLCQYYNPKIQSCNKK